jgi:hypothetical protein
MAHPNLKEPAERSLTPAEAAAFGMPEAAEKNLRAILQKQHDHLEAQLELIRLLLHNGEFDRAKEEILKARHQWPGQSRLDGLLQCANRQEKKHRAKSKSLPLSAPEHVSTSDKTFHLLRFAFCIMAAAVSFSIFFYYFYYLDSSSGPRQDGRPLSLPIGTLVLHALYYGLLIWMLIAGLKNLLQFFLLPDVIALGEEGVFLRSKLQRRLIPWTELTGASKIVLNHFFPKEKLTVFEQGLILEPRQRAGLLSRQFLLKIPRNSIGQFDRLISALKPHLTVREETRETKTGFGLDFF